ncbi:hypothetical protein CHUAL_002830 [Chamberlinius hualienensis]
MKFLINFSLFILIATNLESHSLEVAEVIPKIINEVHPKSSVVIVPLPKPDHEIPAPVISLKIKDADDIDDDEDIKKLIHLKIPFMKMIKTSIVRPNFKKPERIDFGDLDFDSPLLQHQPPMPIPIMCVIDPIRRPELCQKFAHVKPINEPTETIDGDEEHFRWCPVPSTTIRNSKSKISKGKSLNNVKKADGPTAKVVVEALVKNKSVSTNTKVDSKVLSTSTESLSAESNENEFINGPIGERAVAKKPTNVQKKISKIVSKNDNDDETANQADTDPDSVEENRGQKHESVEDKVPVENKMKNLKSKVEVTTVMNDILTVTTDLVDEMKSLIPKGKMSIPKEISLNDVDTSTPEIFTVSTTDEPRTPALASILSGTTAPRPRWHKCSNTILTGAIAAFGYYVYSHGQALTRLDSVKECNHRNMSLAFLTNKNESNLVKRLMDDNSSYWIGLSKQTNKGNGKSHYLWEDGSDAGIFISQYMTNNDVYKSPNNLMPSFCVLKLVKSKLAVECAPEFVHKVALAMCMHRPETEVKNVS